MRRQPERRPLPGRRDPSVLRWAIGGLLVLLVGLAALVGLDQILDALEGGPGGLPPRWVLHGEECLAIYGPGEAPSVCLARGVRTRHGGTNSRGLWGGEVSIDKAPGTVRVVCLGGDLTQGVRRRGDEPGWPGRLANLLERSGEGRSFDVLNAGVGESTASDLLRRWRKDLAPLRPDLVVLLWGGEQFRACRAFAPEAARAIETYMDSGDEEILAGLGGWFARHAAHFRSRRMDRVELVGRAAALGILTPMGSAETGGGGGGLLSDAAGLRSLREEIARRPGGPEAAPHPWNGETAARYQDLDETPIVEALSPLLDEIRAAGARIVLVTHPDGSGCGGSGSIECDAVTEGPAELAAFVAGPLDRALRRLALDRAIPLVDAAGAFRMDGGGCALFAQGGRFLGPRGEKIAARALAPAVLDVAGALGPRLPGGAGDRP